MSDIVDLVPKRFLIADQKLATFIQESKELVVFDDNFDFDKNIWNATNLVGQKGKRGVTTIPFTAWGKPRPSANVTSEFMLEPFLTFAKAYILDEYERTKKVSLNRDLQALRAISKALEVNAERCCVTLLTANILDAAVAIVKRKYSLEAAHGISACIAHIAQIVDNKFIGRIPLQWKNPVKYISPRARIGEEFEEIRNKRLPDSNILVALGRAYQKASHPEDVIYTSMCAVMLGSPDRVNEVASLPEDCESPTLGDGTPGYALRWWPSKGALPQLKAIPEVMQDIVKEAIGRIRKCTEYGRALARFYEDQIKSEGSFPTIVYLPDHLEYLRTQEFVSKDEISKILWGEGGHIVDDWCRKNKIEGIPVSGSKRQIHRFSDVEKAILKELPSHFPYSDNTKRYKCSELLFTMQKFSNTKRRPYACIYVAMDRVDLNYRLDGNNKTSIFSNLGLNVIVDGIEQPFKITSHQFRHYLNHLAHTTGELTEIDIDLWSGRTSRGQTYNHLSSEEISSRTAELIGGSLSQLPALKADKQVKLYVRAEFKRLGIEAGHTTDFGYCAHDFAASPCQKHQECLDCTEQFCIKGDVERERNLRFEKEELEHLVEMAENANSQKKYGADRWLDRQKVNLARAKELLGIIDNPDVPYGAPIRLIRNNNYSKISHARSIKEQDSGIALSKNISDEEKQLGVLGFSLLGIGKNN
ncbi:hypothetical protein QPK32_08555 [Massilia sp. YIM B02763]|uniref:hypothetical protein n=1 Tax=Massilia sp. YIM B02763 TaxID=3050130 RepID=UPI0025B65D4F|nr:hypothetical protein [Massilia sp. YIM B02763]MDN4053127.1 hypothetical protein [Massilia sp. YIM B02763]